MKTELSSNVALILKFCCPLEPSTLHLHFRVSLSFAIIFVLCLIRKDLYNAENGVIQQRLQFYISSIFTNIDIVWIATIFSMGDIYKFLYQSLYLMF